MRKLNNEIRKTLIAIILIMILGTACGPKAASMDTPAQTPNPTTVAHIPPTDTPVPPTSTLEPQPPTPTSIPLLQPNDYLLTVEELPEELFRSFMYVYLEPDGSITYSIMFFNVGVGKIINSITVATQPYNEVPDMTNWAGTRIEDPLLGQNSQAFIDNTNLTYAFYKGNALVQIRSELTLEELVNLGKIIETRLPDMLTFSPIPFPEQLDETAFSQYFNSLTLAKQSPGSDELIPTTTFSKTDNLCLSADTVASNQPFSVAIYDIQEKAYVQKWVSEYGYNCGFMLGFLHPGQYELRTSIDDIEVAILPFEIQ